jgi:hypothetical protein
MRITPAWPSAKALLPAGEASRLRKMGLFFNNEKTRNFNTGEKHGRKKQKQDTISRALEKGAGLG